MSKQKMYAVKCQKTVTFYINVESDNEWQAQHKAEFLHRDESEFIGYSRSMGDIKTVHAVELDDEISSVE